MILQAHSDSSYNNEEHARSSFGGYFWLGWKQNNYTNLKLYGPIKVTVNILKFVAASAAEAELGGLFKRYKKPQ